MDDRRVTFIREANKRPVNDFGIVHYENKIASIHLPGFKYDNFNRAGNIGITSFYTFLDICRAYSSFKKMNEEFQQKFVMNVCHITVSRHLHDRAAIEYPMKHSYQVANVGRSSFDSKFTVTEQLTGEPLLTCLMRSVAVNIKSKTSVTLPDSLRRELLEEVIPGGDAFPAFYPPASVPEHTFSCRITVRYSDMDRIFHTSSKGYFAIIEECAAQATAAGFYSTVDGDIAFYQTESLSIVFVGESFAGDQLEVTTWEDVADRLRLYFFIRKNEETISYAKLQVFKKCAKP
jgi:acyl-CoA thioesterase FadM